MRVLRQRRNITTTRYRIDDSTEDIYSTQTWRQDFTYDRFGNRNLIETNTTTIPKTCSGAVCTADRYKFNPAINASNNNRIDSGQNYTYDAAGNTLTDANSQSYVYDAENKQVTASNGSGTIGQYSYDGDGKSCSVRMSCPIGSLADLPLLLKFSSTAFTVGASTVVVTGSIVFLVLVADLVMLFISFFAFVRLSHLLNSPFLAVRTMYFSPPFLLNKSALLPRAVEHCCHILSTFSAQPRLTGLSWLPILPYIIVKTFQKALVV